MKEKKSNNNTAPDPGDSTEISPQPAPDPPEKRDIDLEVGDETLRLLTNIKGLLKTIIHLNVEVEKIRQHCQALSESVFEAYRNFRGLGKEMKDLH